MRQDLGALTPGVGSEGVPLRGNGALVLTADTLHVFQFARSTELTSPLAAITDVKTTRRHLGEAIARDLLHVAFLADGRRDAVARYVTDLPAWLAPLRPAQAATVT